ncbi:MAG: Uma2 family endonuclease [Cyclobacteriaceae bacterium]|nr:Uma2 family endonuclease [Cyclobacteriaceae bacterium]
MIVAEKDIGLERLLNKHDSLITVAGSLDEFYALEETKADFVNGFIHIQMGASVIHERIFSKIFLQLGLFVNQKLLGEIFGSRLSVGLSSSYHPEPDIFFVANKNSGKYANDRFNGTPDLVIEIISPSTRKLDLEEKRPLYQNNLVPEIYFIDFDNKVVIIDLFEDDKYVSFTLRTGKFASKVLAGLEWEIEKMYLP